jgi:shikimate kinase
VGEPAFRAAECAALEHALAHDASTGAVIALGGGTPTAPGARELIERARTEGRIRVVLLEAPPAVLGSRLSLAPGDRPLLVGADFGQEAVMLAERRLPLYRALADATVSTAAGTSDALAAIERALAD